jgi:hypothetical protein
MALADQLQQLIFSTSGINMENWSAQDQPNASSLTTMLKQAANLMVLQKYFDQWDLSLKNLGDKLLKISLNNWNAAKVGLIIGEDPSPYFYSRIFAKYQIEVQEALLTPTQRNMQAQQLLDINQIFGREVFPPSYVIDKMNMSGKTEAIQFLQQQEQQMAVQQQELTSIQHAFEEAKLKELMSKAANNIAMAKERYGRYESNVGLLEERISEISKNRALSVKAKMEAIQTLVDTIAKYGEVETALKASDIESFQYQDKYMEDREKAQAHDESLANEFASKLMGGYT